VTNRIETPEERTRRIERNNAEFAAMTPAERRVTIAKDALKLLDEKKISAISGYYVEFNKARNREALLVADPEMSLFSRDVRRDPLDVEYSKAERDGGVTCHVCALGSLIVAQSLRMDGFTMPADRADIDMRGAIGRSLGNFFDEDQLCLIECAFERDRSFTNLDESEWGGWDDALTDKAEETNRAVDFGKAFENDAARLRAIMQNIVDNGGTFRP